MVAFLSLVFVGCGSAETTKRSVIVRDSAGIEIVESRRPLWTDGPRWHVADEAAVEIGAAHGGSQVPLHRVGGATRFPDGRIAIANGSPPTILLYDARGRYVKEIGGRGEGPGEFVSLGGFHRFAGDSLIVFDSRLHRLSVFDGAGGFVRSFRLQGVIALPEFPLADGSLAASTRDLVPRSRLKTGVNTDSTTVVMFSMEGVPLDTVGRFPTPETYLWVEGSRITVVPYPFARIVAIAPFGDGFYFGSSDAYEIRAYAPDGTVGRIIRRTDALREATEADVERFTAGVLADAPSEGHRRRLERILAAMSFRETLPAFANLLADAEGYLWVEAYRTTDGAPSRWDVFDREGRWLGAVETPPRLRVHEIGTDYVLGKSEDALGIETVRLHRLTRAGL